ncbi:lasso peptide biosynthesis B2 protein [Paenibacillus hexagrammi]|uniref:Lasso peptide biosynthesis B2 protein n=1 Tax=Paenibacillus hexagrammi TaxID=2908839 RepID=A0ABY3SQB8_9BACL|nr:lasso peptide biosynthesis B2 protein [Paenibacillus sp. YPD9-1]UJF36248.1 lasso peptide biosynthesis B2 protein [Paenibacillus sp. YPD9-1]
MGISMQLLLIEAFFYLGWARILKSLPFSRVAPTLGDRRLETPHTENCVHKALIIDISRAIQMMSRYTFWESKCLVMAIAGMKMLERRGIESTLYLGTAKDAKGKMIAHAWLRSGPFYISGAETMRRFTVVETFGKQMKRLEG